MKLRLGDVTTDKAYALLITTSNEPISGEISGWGSTVSIAPPNQRISAPYLAVARISFDNLRPSTKYSYSISQGAETTFGSFTTLPDSKTAPFSFIVGTCDGPIRRNPTDSFQTIRKLVQQSSIPVLFMATIDDVHYVDEFEVNDGSGFTSSGKPQDTGRAEDYALGWAAHFGMFDSEGKWQMVDRQWVYRNLPHICSGGDHMIEGNHCRGKIGADDYHGCDRSPGGLEEVAVAEWNLFYGSTNPPPLRAGELYWGKEVGPLKIASSDMQLHCEPYNDAAGPTDTPMLGNQQINDIMAYLDDQNMPFKLMFHESGFSQTGQPWLEWHTTEAQMWKAKLDSTPSLNGTSGSFFAIYGDVHACHAVSYDTFWAFGAGTLGDANSVGHGFVNYDFGWGGNLEFLWSSTNKKADTLIGGFYHIIVHADRTPQEIEVNFIKGGSGEIMFSRKITYLANNNQFS